MWSPATRGRDRGVFNFDADFARQFHIKTEISFSNRVQKVSMFRHCNIEMST
jgi:hypothetical protein